MSFLRKYPRWSRYRLEEVRVLVEEYAELREKKGTGTKGGVQLICLLADLGKALRAMPPKEYHAVLVHGLLRLTARDAALVLGVGKSTIDDRYQAGLEWLTGYLNDPEAHE